MPQGVLYYNDNHNIICSGVTNLLLLAFQKLFFELTFIPSYWCSLGSIPFLVLLYK